MQLLKAWAILAAPILASASSINSRGLYARDDSSEGGGAPDSTTGADLTNWVGHPGRSPIEPSQDSFYSKVPDNLSSYSNGQVISKRAISVAGSYQGVKSAYQLRVRSEDTHSSPTVSLATVLIPESPQLINGAVPIIVYETNEDAIFIDCAPSYQLFSQALPEVQSLLSNGFTVVVPDYEGQRGAYSVSKYAGKQVLDSARAAVSMSAVKAGNQTASVGVWGYGMAGTAAGWAAEMASSYAPELPLNAVALGGTVAKLNNWINDMNNSPKSSLVITSLLGMATQYKDVSDALSDNIVPHRRSQFEAAATRCSLQNTLRYFDTNITSQYVTPGVDLLNLPKVEAVYDLNSLGSSPPKVSIFAYHGSNDEVSSLSDMQSVLQAYCKAGTAVKFRLVEGASHVQAQSAEADDVLDYFSSALAGEPLVSSCQRILSGTFSSTY